MSTPATPSPAPVVQNSTNRVAPSWSFITGVALILLVIGLLAWQRISTHGFIAGRQDWVLLLIGVALVTGMVFWLVTPGAEGELNLAHLGLKLTGGAAIGAGFMLIAWGLTKISPTTVIVALDQDSLANRPVVRGLDTENIDLAYQLPDQRVLVEFKDGKEHGWFKTEHLEVGGKLVYLTYKVTRAGLDGQPVRTEEKTP
ncbi:MAG TPA: hypothetical protein VK395_19690 [Gemmataceae bacterium]|nr:hypothetical protein [Gemmataceae bacterium]